MNYAKDKHNNVELEMGAGIDNPYYALYNYMKMK